MAGSTGLVTTTELTGRALDDFEGAGIKWCLLRGEEHLSSLEGDLDILVLGGSAASAKRILLDHGFVAMPRLHRHDPTPFVALAGDGLRWARLDLADNLRIGELGFPIADELIARRTATGNIALLHPHDRFWALLLHAAWEHGPLDERHRRRLRELAAAAEGRGPVTDQLLRLGVSDIEIDKIRKEVAAERWHVVDRRLAGIRRRLLGRAHWRVIRIARRAMAVVRRAILGLGRPGMAIALLGPDGSGKSSLAAELSRSLPIPTRRLYLGLYQRHRARLAVPGIGLVSRLITLAVVGLRAAYHQARGRVVIFDRHPVELAMDLSPSSAALSKLRRRLLSRTFPMADVTLVLDAPPELLSARKPEHTIEEARQQQAGYRRLAQHQALPVISTLDSVEDARRRVVAVVWRRMAARARRRAR